MRNDLSQNDSLLLKAINRVQTHYIEKDSSTDFYDGLLDDILALTESSSGFIGEVSVNSETGYSLTIHVSRDLYEYKASHQEKQTWIELNLFDNILGELLTTKKFVIADKKTIKLGFEKIPINTRSLTSFMALPVLAGKEIIAIVGIANRVDGYTKEVADLILPLLRSYGHILEAFRTESIRNEAEARLQALVENAVDVIIVIDEKCIIHKANPALEKLLGFKAEDVIGKNVNTLMPSPYAENHDSYIENYRSSGIKKIIGIGREVYAQNIAGKLVPVALSVSEFEVDGCRFFTGILHDLTDRKATEDRLKESETRLSNAQRIANLGSWSWERQTGKMYWSDEIFRIFGANKQELEANYTNFYHHVHPDDISMLKDVEKKLFQGESREVVHRIVRSGREIRFVRQFSEVEYNEEGKPENISGTMLDITALKETELELLAAKNQAEYANEAKSEFLSHMSHEFRTPLNAILGFAQLMEFDASISAQQLKRVEAISKAGKHLRTLIDGILDLAKIEAGKFELSIEPIKVAHLIEECRSFIKPLVEKSHVKIDIKPDENCCSDLYILADNTRMMQILLNLLSNAIKYSKKGGSVTLSCNAMENNMLRVYVEDTGRGIAKKELDLLFKPFSRLGAEKSKVEGTGIGLNITKHIVEMMGGTIGVESELGKGSTFWFEVKIDTNRFMGVKDREVTKTKIRDVSSAIPAKNRNLQI